jgi:hypothetical protein
MWIPFHFYRFHINSVSMDFTSFLRIRLFSMVSPNLYGFHLIAMHSTTFLWIPHHSYPHFHGFHLSCMDSTAVLTIPPHC